MNDIAEKVREHARRHGISEDVLISGGPADELAAPTQRVLDRKAPLDDARALMAEEYRHQHGPTLLYAGGDFYQFIGRCWHPVEPAAIRLRCYEFLDGATVVRRRGDDEVLMPFKPTNRDVDARMDALRAVAYSSATPPAWLEGADGLPDPAELIVAPNGVFTLTAAGGVARVCGPTPRLFTTSALDYPLRIDAPEPAEFLAFLEDVFDADAEQITLVQEWFGLMLTADTRYQKALLIIGPPRSGKGTLARVLTRMVGPTNVCSPTLASLASHFGLWPLIGKQLAIISDARLSGRTDQAVVTERLLSITGEDAQTIDRKNREPVTLRLGARFVIMSNELPRLADNSGALANRFLIARLTKSYLGNEDLTLEARLVAEVPQIAAWALRGLARLRQRRRFVESRAAAELREELSDLASPISSFLRDWCRVDPTAEAECAELFAAWCAWCDEQGNRSPGTVQTFGRDLRAALPGVSTRNRRLDDDSRVRCYGGLALTHAAALSAERWRAVRDGTRSKPTHA